jgi:hypothetical protein
MAKLGMSEFAAFMDAIRPAIVQRALAAKPNLYQSIALVLGEEPAKVRSEVAERMKDFKAWERGLIYLLCESDEDDAPLLPGLGPIDSREMFAEELNDHTSNLQFGLALRSAVKDNAPKELVEQASQISAERAKDELTGAVTWLLEQRPERPHPYYVWVYLKETVLRTTYIDWEDRVDETAYGQMQVAVSA